MKTIGGMLRGILIALLISLTAISAYGGLDYPHSSINSIGCNRFTLAAGY